MSVPTTFDNPSKFGEDTTSAQWFFKALAILTAIPWCFHYAEMIRVSFRDLTYCMPLFPLYNNIAWEIVYTFVCNFEDGTIPSAIALLLDCGVLYTTLKFAHREWRHAPYVQHSLGSITIVGLVVGVLFHSALSNLLGKASGFMWGAIICQVFLSVGLLRQIMIRRSTRGSSYRLL